MRKGFAADDGMRVLDSDGSGDEAMLEAGMDGDDIKTDDSSIGDRPALHPLQDHWSWDLALNHALEFDEKEAACLDGSPMFYLWSINHCFERVVQKHYEQRLMFHIVSFLDGGFDYPTDEGNLDYQTKVITAAAVSHDGNWLFTASEDNSIVRTDLTTRKVKTMWTAHMGGVFCLDIGLCLVSGGADNNIAVWSFQGDILCRLSEHTARVRSVKVNPIVTELVSSSDDGTVRVWSIPRRQCTHLFVGHTSPVSGAFFVADKVFLSGSIDASLRIWQASGAHVRKDPGIGPICVVTLNCDRTRLAYANTSSETPVNLRLCSSDTLEDKEVIAQYAHKMCFHPSNPQWLAVHEGANGFLHLIDLSNGRRISSHSRQLREPRDICFTPNGERMVIVGSHIRICNLCR